MEGATAAGGWGEATNLSEGEPLEVTEGHLLYSEARGWTEAEKLEEGEILQTETGNVEVVAIARPDGTAETVYNLEVSGAHRYFVGQAEVLAHNQCPCVLTAAGELLEGANAAGGAARKVGGGRDLGRAHPRHRSRSHSAG